ncbi:MAG: LytR/AlgR family response regulator transcription factor [Marinifilaceae bacterium]
MKDKIRILIVEDEIIIAEDIALRLIEMGYGIAGMVTNGPEAISTIKTQQVDILLIDICLQGKMDGIELAQIINEMYHLPFIFLTSMANNDIVNRAKKVIPSSFLLKPFNDRQVKISIEIALENHPYLSKAKHSLFLDNKEQFQDIKSTKSIFMKKENQFERVDLKDILWIEAESNYTSIHAKNGIFTFSVTLKKIEEKLPPQKFCRVHRSFIVNIDNITGIEGNQLVIHDKYIPISKSLRDLIFQKILII